MDLNEIFKFINFFLAGCFISFLIAIPVISLLYKFKIVRLIDKDFSAIIEERRLKAGTPIMGGLIIIIPVIIITLVCNFDSNVKIPLLVLFISALLGAFDDVLNIYGRERPVRSFSRTLKLARVHKKFLYRIFLILTLPWTAYRWFFYLLGSNPGKGIQAHEKILVQFFIGLLVAWWIYFRTKWFHPGEMWFPFIGNIDFGIFIIPIIIFIVIFMANAVNISDGMDGLSAGMLINSFLSFGIIALIDNNFPIAALCAVISGGILSYLYFNIPPARIQMGDVGTLALGAILATIAFALNRSTLLFIIGFPFVIEILSAVIQGFSRRILGRRIFKMAPFHYHLELMGWTEEKIVMRIWILSPVFSFIGIWLTQF